MGRRRMDRGDGRGMRGGERKEGKEKDMRRRRRKDRGDGRGIRGGGKGEEKDEMGREGIWKEGRRKER